MFTLFFRSVLLYAVMILVMRALGKRQLGEFQPYELALTILLADIISGPIGSVSTPLLYGLLPVAAVFVVHGVLTLACLRSDRIRAVVSGRPTVVVSRGAVNRRELERLCLSLSDLLEGLRGAGFMDPSEVGAAVIEANGRISAFPNESRRPPYTHEMQIQPAYEGLALALVMEGRLQRHNLSSCGRDEKWLTSLLKLRGFGYKQIYLASIDTRGRMRLQLYDGTLMRFQAMPAEEVQW